MLVRAIEAFMTDVNGMPVVVSPDDVMEDSEPIVRRYAHLFRPVSPTRGLAVEQATAAPGELRGGMRRPR